MMTKSFDKFRIELTFGALTALRVLLDDSDFGVGLGRCLIQAHLGSL